MDVERMLQAPTGIQKEHLMQIDEGKALEQSLELNCRPAQMSTTVAKMHIVH